MAEALVEVMSQGSMSLGDAHHADPFADALFEDFPPAQAEVLRRATRVLRERARP